ncbi:MAG: S46 family peptidase [Calditrichaeota bacterium]|nr:S46 family peptidase [Calditrichota bacterium]
MKNKPLFISLAFFILFAASFSAFADEGMFLLDNLQKLGLLSKGLLIPVDDLWNPQDGGISSAVVSLGGCTASFVSPNGLIVTNHHCGYGAIQRNSTKEKNLLEEGFLAGSLEEELPTYGTNVYILQSFQDVTEQVRKGVKKKMSPKEKQARIEKNINKIVQKAEKDKNISARVASMNSGMWYVLYKSLRIKDVRLVYAPPQSIGKFGGDIDNFEWPRQTGDYSFLRAYVGPDGKPAAPSKENVPYKPKKWLRVSADGYADGGFTMVIGFPGHTSRYLSVSEFNYYRNFYFPWRLNMFKRYIALIKERMAENADASIKLASWYAGMMNSQKYSQGVYDGFKRTHLADQKIAMEKELISFINSKKELREKYQDVLPQIDALYKDYMTFAPERYLYRWMRLASSVVGSAATIVKWSEEKQKKEIDREPDYSDNDIARRKERMKYRFRNFDEEMEKRALLLFFQLAHELSDEQKIETIEKIAPGLTGEERREVEKQFIDNMFAKTTLTTLDGRMKLFDASEKELEKSDDAAIRFARSMEKDMKSPDEKTKMFEGKISELQPEYIEALMAWKGGSLYPDANGTKRLTFGYVKGYSPRDAVEYDYYTTTKGILQKYTGKEPFDSPQKLLQEIRAKDFGRFRDARTDKMHVNFLTTLDTTGGNSGSPVLNARGRSSF